MASRTKGGPSGVLRICELIQCRQLTLPHMQANGHEGIILASPRSTSGVLILDPSDLFPLTL
jgi:hypothetical protein